VVDELVQLVDRVPHIVEWAGLAEHESEAAAASADTAGPELTASRGLEAVAELLVGNE
jgi:hypothetical protein